MLAVPFASAAKPDPLRGFICELFGFHLLPSGSPTALKLLKLTLGRKESSADAIKSRGPHLHPRNWLLIKILLATDFSCFLSPLIPKTVG